MYSVAPHLSEQPLRFELLRTFDGHAGAVYGLSVAPDAVSFLSASKDRSVKLWHIEVRFQMIGLILRSHKHKNNEIRLESFSNMFSRFCKNVEAYVAPPPLLAHHHRVFLHLLVRLVTVHSFRPVRAPPSSTRTRCTRWPFRRTRRHSSSAATANAGFGTVRGSMGFLESFER